MIIISWIKNTIKILGIYLLIFLAVITVNTKVLHIYFVPTGSMENTLPTDSIVIGNRIKCQEVERKDIVTFRHKKAILVKRVIGLPGETVRITDNQVYVNDEPLNELYVKEPMIQEDAIFQVPENCVFVMGDNRNNSQDSRFIGSIPIKKILSNGGVLLHPRLRLL